MIDLSKFTLLLETIKEQKRPFQHREFVMGEIASLMLVIKLIEQPDKLAQYYETLLEETK